MRRKVGTANSGVAQNTSRNGAEGFSVAPPALKFVLPLARFAKFLDAAANHVAFEHAEVLDEKNAVQMIDFVAESASEQVFAANFKRLAEGILCADGHKERPEHIAAKTGERKAAFIFALFAFRVSDFRIGDDNFRFGILPYGSVDYGKPQIDADLRRRKAHALRGVHGDKHIGAKLLQLGVESRDGLRGAFENWIAVLHDRIYFYA